MSLRAPSAFIDAHISEKSKRDIPLNEVAQLGSFIFANGDMKSNLRVAAVEQTISKSVELAKRL